MKKIILILAAVSMLGFASCKKTCECETKAAGVVISTKEVEIDDGDCEDLDKEVLGQKVYECKKK